MQKTPAFVGMSARGRKDSNFTKIQQNIALSQHVTLKSVDLRLKPLKYRFHINVRLQRR